MEINWIYLSLFILVSAATCYAIHAWNREVYPNPVSWFVWVVTGVAIFLTADAAEAKEVYLANIVGFLSPAIVFLIILIRETNRIYSLSFREKLCLVFSLIGYGLWLWLGDTPELAKWSLYWMIAVDLIAVWPTIEQVFSKPMSDKPFPWMMFGIGYIVAGFAIEDNTTTNWILPIYMFVASWTIATPMLFERIKNRIPIRQWF